MNKDKRIEKYELMSMDQLEKLLVGKFNRSIVLRDLYRDPFDNVVGKCIACGKIKTINMSYDLYDCCASHYFLSDRYASTRFDRVNVNLGCRHCNKELSGNLAKYKIGLVQKVGPEEFEALEIRHNQIFKPTWKFLVDMIFESEEISKQRIKELRLEPLKISIN